MQTAEISTFLPETTLRRTLSSFPSPKNYITEGALMSNIENTR